MSFYGSFGGQNPQERLGLVYQIFPGTFSLPRIQGAVIYAPVGTTVPAAASSTSTAGMAMSRGGVPVPATASAPTLPADWSRWSGGAPAGGRLSGNGETLSGIGMVPPGLVGIEGSPAAADRAAVIRQAEQLMGGMITFGGAAREQR